MVLKCLVGLLRSVASRMSFQNSKRTFIMLSYCRYGLFGVYLGPADIAEEHQCAVLTVIINVLGKCSGQGGPGIFRR